MLKKEFQFFRYLEIQGNPYATADLVYHWNDCIYFRMENMLYEWKNSEAAPRMLSYFELNELNDKNTWIICEGQLFYTSLESGEMREIKVLENFDK